MPHIIFNRKRFTPFYMDYIVSDNRNDRLIGVKDEDVNIIKESVKNGYEPINFNLKQSRYVHDVYGGYFETYISLNSHTISHSQISNYINTITTEFDIECDPYDLNEIVYVSSINEFHKLLSRYRDDNGSWIYETALCNSVGSEFSDEKYSDEEIANFEKIKLDSENIRKEQEFKIEKCRVKVLAEIEEIIREYNNPVELVKDYIEILAYDIANENINLGLHKRVIRWVKKLFK